MRIPSHRSKIHNHYWWSLKLSSASVKLVTTLVAFLLLKGNFCCFLVNPLKLVIHALRGTNHVLSPKVRGEETPHPVIQGCVGGHQA